jgi:hypothetical protein
MMAYAERTGWSRRARSTRFTLLTVVMMLFAAGASAQWKIETEDGSSMVKFGFLLQGRAETLDAASGETTARDLYIRRFRLLAGGKITDKLGFFVETDSPNMGKGLPDGSKNRPDIYFQDVVLTYKFTDSIMLDGGLILIPTCYNCNESAAALLPVDYGAYSFISSGPTTSNVGRDYGVQARGYLANQHLEVRLGIFQGARGSDANNGFRTTGRVMWHVWEPQTGLFYLGTSLGTKRLLAFGASFDVQEEYETYALDAFFDHPVGKHDAITLQADWVTWDGSSFLTAIPEQDTWLFEGSYYLGAVKLAPFVQYLTRDFADDSLGTDETRWQAGLAWYPRGSKLSIKLAAGRIETDVSPDRFQGILQLQVFQF